MLFCYTCRFGIIISNNCYYTDRNFLMMWAKLTSYAIQNVQVCIYMYMYSCWCYPEHYRNGTCDNFVSTHLAVFLAISRMSFQYFRGGMVWSRSFGIRMTSEPRLISIRVLAPRVFSKETRSWGHGREGGEIKSEREEEREGGEGGREGEEQSKHRKLFDDHYLYHSST